MDPLQATLFSIGTHPVSEFTVIIAAIVAVLGVAGTGAVECLVNRALTKKGIAPGTRALLCRTGRYALWGVATVLVLELLGFDLMAAIGAGAVLFVGLGIAVQKFLESIVAGFLLLAEREIEADDVLEFDGELVRVVNIGLRTTVVHSRTDGNIIVPNAQLAQNPIRNRTYRDSTFRVRVDVGVEYGTPIEDVDRCLRVAALEVPHRVMNSPTLVLLEGFGPSSLDFAVFVKIDDPWESPLASSELRRAVYQQLSSAGIVIAYPQLDVHIAETAVTALAS